MKRVFIKRIEHTLPRSIEIIWKREGDELTHSCSPETWELYQLEQQILELVPEANKILASNLLDAYGSAKWSDGYEERENCFR